MQKFISIAAIATCLAIVIGGHPNALGGTLCDGKNAGACTRDWLKDFVLPAAALGAAIFAARFAFRQAKASQDQIATAREQINLLAADQRPWLKPEFEFIGQVGDGTADRPSMFLLRITIRNLGNRPAVRAVVATFNGGDGPAPHCIRERIEAAIASDGRWRDRPLGEYGYTIFPDDVHTEQSFAILLMMDGAQNPLDTFFGVLIRYQGNEEGPTFFSPGILVASPLLKGKEIVGMNFIQNFVTVPPT